MRMPYRGVAGSDQSCCVTILCSAQLPLEADPQRQLCWFCCSGEQRERKAATLPPIPSPDFIRKCRDFFLLNGVGRKMH